MPATTVIDYFREDLKKIRQKLTQIISQDVRESGNISGKIGSLLEETELHIRLLDETLYPAIENAVDAQNEGLFDAFREFSDESRHLGFQLRGMDPGSPIFLEKLTEFQAAFEDYEDDLNTEVFVRAEQLLGSELETMRERYLTRKNELQSLQHPETRNEGRLQIKSA